MYGKIFSSIYDGTLSEDWRALITFQQLIILSDADGMVDMTPQSIARRTGIPIEHIISGLEVLSKEDKYSRTPDQEGRRIELIDDHRPWGWHIVNHEKYKNMRDVDTIRAQTRERVRRHREKKRAVTLGNASKRHIDKETDININTDINTNTKIKTKGRFAPPSVKQVREYCQQRNNGINPDDFINHYEANGWMRGKTKIKDWKACVRTWENKRGNDNGSYKQTNKQSLTERATQARKDYEQFECENASQPLGEI